MCQALHRMKTLDVLGVIVAVTIIAALAGIAVVAAGASLLVQSASATDIMISATVGGGEEEAVSTTTPTNNVSNAVLGSLFLSGEDKLTSLNPINETYTEVSYVGNRTIMPIDGIAAATITATETGNLTLKLQSNGITFVEGQSLLVTQGGGGNNSGGAEQQENATALLVDLNGIRPDDPRSSTGVAFFSTNSTGQLAFLDSLIAIYQVKTSSTGTAIQMWEWKGSLCSEKPLKLRSFFACCYFRIFRITLTQLPFLFFLPLCYSMYSLDNIIMNLLLPKVANDC